MEYSENKNNQVGTCNYVSILQIDQEMYTKVLNYIEAGKTGGAKCVAGGDKLGGKGYYIQPTVFADVKDDMKIAREEVKYDLIYQLYYNKNANIARVSMIFFPFLKNHKSKKGQQSSV